MIQDSSLRKERCHEREVQRLGAGADIGAFVRTGAVLHHLVDNDLRGNRRRSDLDRTYLQGILDHAAGKHHRPDLGLLRLVRRRRHLRLAV